MSAQRRSRRPAPDTARDQHESAFGTILADLVARIPGARAAALVDVDGEAVDYAGRTGPFEVKLAAAHWRIILHEIRAVAALGDASFVAIRATRASYVVRALPDGYAIVIVFSRAAGFSGWRRAVDVGAHALIKEAGWEAGTQRPPAWYPVDVTTDDRRRPKTLHSEGKTRSLEVLGAVVGAFRRSEKSWRVRMDTGLEATLVREASGRWYVDELDDAAETAKNSHDRRA